MLKRERINRRRYQTVAEARADVFDYIERFHNPRMQRRLNALQEERSALTQLSARMGQNPSNRSGLTGPMSPLTRVLLTGAALLLTVGCEDRKADHEAALLRAAVDALLDETPEGSPKTSRPLSDVAVYSHFLRTHNGLPMHPGMGTEAFEGLPSESLARAALLVPPLRACTQPEACTVDAFQARVLTVSRPTVENNRAAVYIVDNKGRYVETYLVTLVRRESVWVPVTVRLIDWDH